jgi:hypothetical protein
LTTAYFVLLTYRRQQVGATQPRLMETSPRMAAETKGLG